MVRVLVPACIGGMVCALAYFCRIQHSLHSMRIGTCKALLLFHREGAKQHCTGCTKCWPCSHPQLQAACPQTSSSMATANACSRTGCSPCRQVAGARAAKAFVMPCSLRRQEGTGAGRTMVTDGQAPEFTLRCLITCRQVFALCESLVDDTHVVSLDLSYNNLNDMAAQAIAGLIKV